MIDGKRVLWCWNVYDRPVDLRVNTALLRDGLGEDVDIGVFCNCPEQQRKDFLWDGSGGPRFFVWEKNTGHHMGTLDSYFSFRDMLKTTEVDYDYIVIAHAKSWWGDYSLLRGIIREMSEKSKELAYIHLKPAGALNDSRYMGMWLDFMIFSKSTYLECVEKIEKNNDLWSEVLVYNATRHVSEDKRLVIEQCDVPIETRSDVPPCNKIFDNFIEKGHFILAHYSIATKSKFLRERYPDVAERIKKYLPDDVETWHWNRRS